MEKLSENLNDKEIEAVKKLLSKLHPEDLEKVAGGISPRARNILLVTGLLAVTGITSTVLISKIGSKQIGGKGFTQSGHLVTQNDPVVNDEHAIFAKTLDKMIEKYNISEKLIEAVGGKEKVFDAWTYYDHPKEEGDKCVGEPKLKKGFDLYEGRIYHKGSQYGKVYGFATGEEGRGVPYNELEW